MNKIELGFGQVRCKRIVTPNHFVSHMIEHIAWRMGCSIELEWDNSQWQELGTALGQAIGKFPAVKRQAASLGMIDDGSAEVAIILSPEPDFQMTGCAQAQIEYFLSLRCEQLTSGTPLFQLLTGLAHGVGLQIDVLVCSLLDPHHTWEGVFRGLGNALSALYAPPQADTQADTQANKKLGREQAQVSNPDGIEIKDCSCMAVTVCRSTAESELELTIDFNAPSKASLLYEGTVIDHFAGTKALSGLEELLNSVALACGFCFTARFRSKALSSSHVLLEDTGMVFGRALGEIMVRRMADTGINGAGSSLNHPRDITTQKISAGISVEGRKSCLFVPLANEKNQLYKEFIIGKSIAGGVYTEDLDDFFDGFTWGMGCSLIFHFKQIPDVEEGWRELFSHFGAALNQVFQINTNRQGVPPGVKANLY